MTDFAKYAFNKSHAAAYAVVAYQTAYLKYYYPLEYMAALMSSVMDHVGKISEYIYTCRQTSSGCLLMYTPSTSFSNPRYTSLEYSPTSGSFTSKNGADLPALRIF